MRNSIPNKPARPNHFTAPLRYFKRPLLATLDFFLPPTCLLCLAGTHSRQKAALCPACWGALTPLGPDNPNVAAMLEDAGFDSFQAPFLYNEAAGGLVQKLKYNDGLRLAGFMAGQMVPSMPEGVDVLVPVPLHGGRLRQRKYNQSAALVWHLARETGIQRDLTTLQRTRHTTSQVGQPAKVRRKQLKDAFHAPADAFKGLRVALVDDVCTTGSTAHWCAVGLKKAGAKEVHLLTFAYVEPKLN